MNNSHALITIAVSLVPISWFLLKEWPRLAREDFRRDMFTLRNELFLFMVLEKHDFSDAGYREARSTLNDMVRISNWITWPKFLGSMVLLRFYGNPSGQRQECESEIAAIRRKCDEIVGRAMVRYISFVFFSGPSSLFFNCLYYSFRLTKMTIRWKDKFVRNAQETVKYELSSPPMRAFNDFKNSGRQKCEQFEASVRA